MRCLILLLLLTVPCVAADVGPRPHGTPPPADPAVMRQGGDTFADAVAVAIPVLNQTGTTVGYTDDYDEVCPYDGSTSPDVVYRFTMTTGYRLIIDLYGSMYDTKVYAYDEDFELLGCNDDEHPDYTSRLEVNCLPGEIYVVIDGYGGDAGEYLLNIDTIGWPIVYCPDDGVEEGEPELVDDYVDAFNGGCDSLDLIGAAPMLPLTGPTFCGQSGVFLRDGLETVDSDWFVLTLPASGALTMGLRAQFFTTIEALGPTDCGTATVHQSVDFGPFMVSTISLAGEPGESVWLRVVPTTDNLILTSWLYVFDLPDVVSVQQRSWSEIKSLYQ